MNKKIILVVAAFVLIFTNGCEETTPDPQELLREAFENAFSINSAAFSSSGSIRVEDVESANGEIKFTLEGKGEDIFEFPPKIDYLVGAELSFQNLEENQNFTGSGEFSVKMLNDAIFAKFELTELIGNPELEAAKPLIQMFSGKWYKFSLETLASANPEFEAAFAQQQESQQKFIEFYKKLLNENDLLLVENLQETSEDYILEVKPNFDLIFSEEFLNNVRNDLLELIKEIDENAPSPPELDDEIRAKLPEIREIAEKIWQTGNFKTTMKIGKENRIAHTSTMNGSLDLMEIAKIIPEKQREEIGEMAEKISGKIIFNLTSESRDFNKPQNITPPEDFIDFDPAMIFGGGMIPPPDFTSPPILPDSESGELNFPPIPKTELEEIPPEENQPIARPQ